MILIKIIISAPKVYLFHICIRLNFSLYLHLEKQKKTKQKNDFSGKSILSNREGCNIYVIGLDLDSCGRQKNYEKSDSFNFDYYVGLLFVVDLKYSPVSE